MLISVRVKPSSSKEVVLRDKNLYLIYTRVPAQKGKANKRALELLAEFLKVKKSSLRIVRGHTSSNKIVEVRES